MSLSLSRLAGALPPSATLRLNSLIAALRSKGEKIISLCAGEPDFDTPEHIRKAAVQALENGCTRYTDVAGILPLRKAVCRRLYQDKGVSYTPEQILVGAGAKQVLFEALQAILDPSDEVLLPLPAWISYPQLIRMAGGVPVTIRTTAAAAFLPDAQQLEAAVTDRTKAIIINTPANPSGAVWPPKLLESVHALAQKHDFFIISDEIYEKLTYDGAQHLSPASLHADAAKRTIVISGLSKAYAMTGWRVGYAAGPQSVIAAMTALQSHASGNINTLAQYAALEALEGSQQSVSSMAQRFAQRRNLLLNCLSQESLTPAMIPQGAFYLLLDVRPFLTRSVGSEIIRDDEDFARKLLECMHVAVTPGTPFGVPGHVRLSYAVKEEDITQGVRKMSQFIRSLK